MVKDSSFPIFVSRDRLEYLKLIIKILNYDNKEITNYDKIDWSK